MEIPGANPLKARGTILIVDDDEVILDMLELLMQEEGYHTLTAQNGEAALKLLSEHSVDVILTDQRMPGMMGTDLLSRAKDMYPETVRIVQSGFADLASVTSAINDGAIYKFLTKPWNNNQLKQNIAEAFKIKYLEDENRNLTASLENTHQQLLEQSNDYEKTISFLTATLNITLDAIESIAIPVIEFDANKSLVKANKAAYALWDDTSFDALSVIAGDILNKALLAKDVLLLEIPQGCGHRYHVKCKAVESIDASHRYVLLLVPA